MRLARTASGSCSVGSAVSPAAATYVPPAAYARTSASTWVQARVRARVRVRVRVRVRLRMR